ncbi:MAG: RibD family protein [Brevundimonas sp.]
MPARGRSIRVTLKLATSLDGRIATATGESRWITGEAARFQGHRLRAAHDAILVGVGTVLADDPELTARLPGRPVDQPLRVVLDSRLRTPSTAKVASGDSLILTVAEPRPVGTAAVERVGAIDGRPAVVACLDALGRRGVSTLLIEGGGEVAASFLRAGRVDRLEWFRAPILLGGEGRPCVAALALAKLADAPTFRRVSAEPVGDDLWERYDVVRPS